MYHEVPEEQNNTQEDVVAPEPQPTEEDLEAQAASEEESTVEPEKAPADEQEMPKNDDPSSEIELPEEGEAVKDESVLAEPSEETEEMPNRAEDDSEIEEAPEEKPPDEPSVEQPIEFVPIEKKSEVVIVAEGDIPDKEEEYEGGEYSDEERRAMLERMEETMASLKEGEIIQGKVLNVAKDEVTVDIGFKSEAIVSKAEFPDEIKEGDTVEIFLEQLEDDSGQAVVSKRKADFMRVWNQIYEAYETGGIIKGVIKRRIKGGMVVDFMGIDAFLPGSQIALRQVPDFDALVGEEMDFRIIKLNKIRRNIVVSRRVVLEEERSDKRKELLESIEEGQVCPGIVKNITDFGVFIDLGGLDGLLHITDMSWSRIKHPSEIVKLGDKIDVKILKYDQKKERISLGLKQLTPSPWEAVEEKYPEGSRIRGKVVNITKYGAFVELEDGIEGLVHVSEMSWTKHINHPSEVVSVGDEVDVVVLNVDKESQKISLGIKQLEPDPWTLLATKYPPGSKIKGTVRNLTSFGAFVEIEDGIDGLIHISDMSWTKRIMHPSEIVHKGDEVEVVVLNIDPNNRRVSLGIKQLDKDPWPELSGHYSVGREIEGRVARMSDRGVTVILPDGVEGFVPVTQLGKEVNRPQEAFSEGDLLPLKVIEFDAQERRIVLSVNAFFESKEQSDLNRYLAAHPTKTVSLEEAIGKHFPSETNEPVDYPDRSEDIPPTPWESPIPEAPEQAEPEPEEEINEPDTEEMAIGAEPEEVVPETEEAETEEVPVEKVESPETEVVEQAVEEEVQVEKPQIEESPEDEATEEKTSEQPQQTDVVEETITEETKLDIEETNQEEAPEEPESAEEPSEEEQQEKKNGNRGGLI